MTIPVPLHLRTEPRKSKKAKDINRLSAGSDTAKTAKAEEVVENKSVDGTIPLSGDGNSQRSTIGKKTKTMRKTKAEKKKEQLERKTSIQKAIESVADSEKKLMQELEVDTQHSKNLKNKKTVKAVGLNKKGESSFSLKKEKASNIDLKGEKRRNTKRVTKRFTFSSPRGKRAKSKAEGDGRKSKSRFSKTQRLQSSNEIKFIEYENKERTSAAADQSVEESVTDEEYFVASDFVDRSQMLLHESYDDMLRRDIDEESSSTSEEAECVKPKRLSLDSDFLDEFQSLPELDQLSMHFSSDERSEIVTEDKAQSSQDVVSVDKGKFVNPLTGELIESFDDKSKIEEVVEIVQEEVEEEDVPEEDELPEFDIEFEFEESEPESKVVIHDDDISTFQDFVQSEGSKVQLVIDTTPEDREALEQARILAENTDDFLRELIADVVHKCESHDEAKLLRKNLDKNKLINDLYNLVMDHRFETQKNELLNRKIIDFYKRKKILRTILPDPPEMVAANKEKYIAAIHELDHLLYKEELLRDYTAFSMEQTRIELNEKQNIVSDLEQKLESLIEKTIMDCGFPNIQTVVDRQLAIMAAKRNEISEVRFALIIKQDTLAKLKAKMFKIEDLGNGLSMRKFEHMQTETQALDKKIEDKNSELNKVREYCNSNLHILTHMREKQQIILEKISEQEQRLAELQAKRKNYREYLLQLKLQRLQIREELRELSFHGGLLDKPTLMLDYDKTVETLKERYNKVDQLRKMVISLAQRISAIEDKQTLCN